LKLLEAGVITGRPEIDRLLGRQFHSVWLYQLSGIRGRLKPPSGGLLGFLELVYAAFS
jgi:hypothetical protein